MKKSLFVLITFCLAFSLACSVTSATIADESIEYNITYSDNENTYLSDLNIENIEYSENIVDNAISTTLTNQGTTIVQGTPYKVLLKGNNVPLANMPVNFKVNGVDNNIRYTDANGIASININLNPGTYTIVSSFAGNGQYSSSSITNSITSITRTTSVSHMAEKVHQTDKFSVTLRDSLGNLLPNQQVSFTINNIPYYKTTDTNGIASVTINLNPGQHTINYAFGKNGGYLASSGFATINSYEKNTVVNIINNVAYAGQKIAVKVTDSSFVPIANKQIKLVINQGLYTITSDSKGIAYFSTNNFAGYAGQYSISAVSIYETGYLASDTASTTFTIKNAVIFSSTALTTTTNVVKQGQTYVLDFKNSQSVAIANAPITFKVNNLDNIVRYTDANGRVSLTINLDPGTYQITARYEGTSYGLVENFNLIQVPNFSRDKNKTSADYSNNDYYIIYNDPYSSIGNSYVDNLARELTTTSSNILEKSIAIYNYVSNFKKENRGGSNHDAFNTLLYYKGNCVDHINPLISLYREESIPVRFVVANSNTPGQFGHAWAQVLINNVWITVDPTNSFKFGVWGSGNDFYNPSYYLRMNSTHFYN